MFVLVVALIGLTLTGASCGNSSKVPESLELQYWTIETEQADIDPVLTGFQKTHPYVEIEVRKFTLEEYENKLIEAWSHNEGPDLFSIPNHHLGKFKTYIKPLPANLAITSVTQKDSFAKKQTIVTPETIKGVSPQKMASLFPQVVTHDVVLEDPNDDNTKKVYAMPLSLDTLVLYYNKDLLSRTSIAMPANNWDDFHKQAGAPKLTLIDINNTIVQAGASLGTCNNITLCFDILSLLMMQNGVTMGNESNIGFADADPKDKKSFPGVHAVEFYTSFANPKAEWYSWNADQPDAFEAFSTGRVAYYFGYFYQLDQLRKKAPNLNFDIAPVPQINANNPVNYANYWLESVSNNSKHPNEAWAFLQMLATDETAAKTYNDAVKKPAALNSLIKTQQEDFTLAIFANQVLTAKSWYTGQDPNQAKVIFSEMIDQINKGTIDAETAVKNAATKIALTYQINED